MKLKTNPTTPECSYSEHHPNGNWVNCAMIDGKGRKFEVLQYTCMGCGERWFTKINDK